MDDHRDLFEYTSGRWIYNEDVRLAERRLSFNVNELKKAAAKSVKKSESDVVSLRKLAEGGFNRIFEVTMRDGTCVLARLPYPSTLPRRLAVASEVATIDFVRAHGIPTPRVFGYAFNENPVGSECILMEKLCGQPIGDNWYNLSEQQRLQVLHDIVKLESKLFSIQLPASGSIYYTRDLDRSTPKVDVLGLDGQFCVGPYTGLRWWYGKRAELKLDRWPHIDTVRVLRAPAEKELSWIREYAQPRDPESVSFTPPHLPVDLDSLDEAQRAQAHEQFRRRQVHFFYLGFTQRFNQRHWRALEQEPDLLRGRIFDHAGEPWDGLNTTLQHDLVQIARNWEKIAPRNHNGAARPCPVSFTQKETDQIEALAKSHRDADGDVEQINEFLGIASDGWTPNERFESAKDKSAEIREQALASANDDPWLREMSGRHWPFDDYDEDE
ncbi:hypothetical protein B5807_01856 [Epicoccum nigrum]|uniref:Uncharacterized protein n=1 Tax=Epicoccum nigrum TaxID=105696 RepID=A0A1Y2MAS4_EPING|nr:hypothetical protein B5807_01856 [Epicoccum nigrum]